jgi:hypothetical protein
LSFLDSRYLDAFFNSAGNFTTFFEGRNFSRRGQRGDGGRKGGGAWGLSFDSGVRVGTGRGYNRSIGKGGISGLANCLVHVMLILESKYVTGKGSQRAGLIYPLSLGGVGFGGRVDSRKTFAFRTTCIARMFKTTSAFGNDNLGMGENSITFFADDMFRGGWGRGGEHTSTF